jgi:hypothetical protein
VSVLAVEIGVRLDDLVRQGLRDLVVPDYAVAVHGVEVEFREFLSYWLKEIVEPNLAPKTYERYEMFSRLHIIPYLGSKHLDKIQVKDIRQWMNKLAVTCQCCTQGKDDARLEHKRRDREMLWANALRA